MLKFCILLLTILLLQGCSSSSTNKTLLTVTSQQLQKDHKLNHGTLIIQYNLAALSKNNCIYAKDFGLIINNSQYNKVFLQKFKASCAENINNQAMIRSTKIKNLLLKLNCVSISSYPKKNYDLFKKLVIKIVSIILMS